MPTLKKRLDFLQTDEGIATQELLTQMTNDTSYVTQSSYSANSELYPDNRMSFVQKHLNYLVTHPSVNPQQYLSNLRIITRVR